ncbi:ATP-binding protein [Candidatus Sumerlaeota bacterium]
MAEELTDRGPKAAAQELALPEYRIRTRLVIAIPVLMVLLPLAAGVYQFNILVKLAAQSESDEGRALLYEALLELMVMDGALLLIAAGLGFALARYIMSAIKRIVRAFEDIGQAGIDQEVAIAEGDELSMLGASFNQMIRSLNHTFEERNRYILECYTGGLITVDREGRVTAVNSAAEQILETPGNELMGVELLKFLKGRESAEDLLYVVTQGIKGGRFVQSQQMSIATREGRQFPLLVTTSMLKGRDGAQQGTIINFRDLTKYKAFHQRLTRTDRLATAGTLAMGVAHEIRNPLASIRGMAQLLQQDLPDGSSHREYADVIISESRRLDHAVRELVDFSHPDEATKERCQLNDVIREALRGVRARSLEEGRQVVIEEDYGSLPEQALHAEKMLQAIANILNNAVQAVDPDSGRVWISTTCLDEEVQGGAPHRVIRVEIANNGPQIPPADLDRIFEPFYSQRDGGTGLGLSIAYQIITFNGGEIEVQSSPTQTAFTITFG